MNEMLAANSAMKLAIQRQQELAESLGSPDVEAREEGLTMLAEMVSVSYGENGRALGRLLRESGVVPVPLTALLADEDHALRLQASVGGV